MTRSAKQPAVLCSSLPPSESGYTLSRLGSLPTDRQMIEGPAECLAACPSSASSQEMSFVHLAPTGPLAAEYTAHGLALDHRLSPRTLSPKDHGRDAVAQVPSR